jgi:hypothetical protein
MLLNENRRITIEFACIYLIDLSKELILSKRTYATLAPPNAPIEKPLVKLRQSFADSKFYPPSVP